jgi:hypothetical protein
MSWKSVILAGAATIALAAAPVAPAFAATTAGNAASSAVNKTEHAVGAKEAFTKEELKSAVALNKLDMPKEKLSNAKVEDHSGANVGEVHDVVMNKAGKPTALHVDVGGFLGIGERMVSIPASRFTWLPDKNILVANMTKKQIESLKKIDEKKI